MKNIQYATQRLALAAALMIVPASAQDAGAPRPGPNTAPESAKMSRSEESNRAGDSQNERGGFDLGWMGLLGLAGLVGLMPRKRTPERRDLSEPAI